MKFRFFSRIFNEENFGNMVDQLNAALNNITLEDNFAGDTISVTLPANEDFAVSHNLKDIPKHKIITRQCEEGTILDTKVNEWSSTKIFLKFVPSGGATSCDTTILLTRG